MTTTLHPDWQAYLDKPAEGRYPSVEAALDEALTDLLHRELAHRDLKQLIQEGLDSGPSVSFDESLLDSVKQRGRDRLAMKTAAEWIALILSPAAVRDLDDIWFYIAQTSLRQADEVVEAIRRSSLNLTDQPLMGRLREDLAPGLRSWAVRPHLVFYRPIDNAIDVVRILHGARNITPDLF